MLPVGLFVLDDDAVVLFRCNLFATATTRDRLSVVCTQVLFLAKVKVGSVNLGSSDLQVASKQRVPACLWVAPSFPCDSR